MVARSHEVPWSLDREIVLSRVFEAPRELVFAAWTKEEHLTKWFGPKGFTTNTHERDLRMGVRGKTRVPMRQLHPTKEQRDAGIGFGAVEIGYTTRDKLAEHLRRMQ